MSITVAKLRSPGWATLISKTGAISHVRRLYISYNSGSKCQAYFLTRVADL